MKFTIKEEKLSDNSKVYNVVGIVDGKTITFGCDSKNSAGALYEMLRTCVSWIEIDPR